MILGLEIIIHICWGTETASLSMQSARLDVQKPDTNYSPTSSLLKAE